MTEQTARLSPLTDAGERIQLLKNLAIVGGLLLVLDQDSKG